MRFWGKLSLCSTWGGTTRSSAVIPVFVGDSPQRGGIRSKERHDKVKERERIMQKQSRTTAKGQITVPRDIRRALDVRPGGNLLFENDGSGVHVRPVRARSLFEKYRGIGNLGIPTGRKGISRWLRGLRGR